MPVLEVFFDYACPFCMRGHENLAALLPQFPEVTVMWRPCEAHPRPEQHGRHSDLCARAMLFAQECGADLYEFHRRMYAAAQTDRADIESADALAEALAGLLNRSALLEALSGSRCADELDENNRLVWEVYDCPAVPSYRMGGETLKSEPGVGVSRERLGEFLTRHK